MLCDKAPPGGKGFTSSAQSLNRPETPSALPKTAPLDDLFQGHPGDHAWDTGVTIDDREKNPTAVPLRHRCGRNTAQNRNGDDPTQTCFARRNVVFFDLP
jgi:hypothetical protein